MGCERERRAGSGFHFHEGGWFDFVCRDADGSVAWEERVVLNAVTTAGLNDILSAYFAAGTQRTSWFIGLIDNTNYTTGVQAADVMTSHSGWQENTGYSNGTRPQWIPTAPSGGSVTGQSSLSFNINATVTIKGAFLASDGTKGGTSGLLWATGLFGAAQSLLSGQTISVNYTCPATAS